MGKTSARQGTEAKRPQGLQVPDEITVIHHSAVFRGDHAADVQIATIVSKDATVEQLQQMMGERTDFNAMDWLEIPAQQYRVNGEE